MGFVTMSDLLWTNSLRTPGEPDTSAYDVARGRVPDTQAWPSSFHDAREVRGTGMLGASTDIRLTRDEAGQFRGSGWKRRIVQ
jgi:hypothetical protein